MSPQAAAAARARAVPAPAPLDPLRRPAAPRRVSGPVRQPRAAERRSPIARVLDAPFLDRLLRGRVWIALVGIALFGIVAMQVTILRVGASIGASVTQIQQLEQANQNAETAIARLEPGRGVAGSAARLGMVYPPAGNVVYLHASPGQAASAAASITRPTAPLVPIGSGAALTAPLASVATTGSQATTSTAQPQLPAAPTQTGVTTAGSTVAPAASGASSSTPGPGGGSVAPGG